MPTSDGRGALCYTPERLIRSKDYRILVPAPRRYPTLADLLVAQRRTFEKGADGGKIVETKDDRKIGKDELPLRLMLFYIRSVHIYVIKKVQGYI